MKYGKWLGTWLELYVCPAVKMQTYEKYERNVRVHIVPALGEFGMEELDAETLQRFVVGLTKKLAPNTVNGVITVLKKSLKTAVSLGISRVQYADKIIRPRLSEKKIECFTSEEQKKIEHAVICGNDRKLFGVVLSLYTGLRLGEILSLRWSDIDMKRGMLSVNRSSHYGKDGKGGYAQITDTPKTLNSVREIPVPRQLLPYMRWLKNKSRCDLVINRQGKQINTRTYQYGFERLLKRLNIPHRGFHALRHTFATRALESGMDVKTLSEILGHKNSTVTMNRYAHSLTDHKRDAMNKLGRFFNGENGKK